jgi:E3 ubiquitin-protein ligase UBR1
MITTPSPAIAFHTAAMLQQVDLGVVIRHANDTCKEEIAGMLISWLAEMCHCHIGGDDQLLRRIIGDLLLEPCAPRHTAPAPAGKVAAYDLKSLWQRAAEPDSQVTRLDWLLQQDARMWKRPKWELREMYAGVYALGRVQREQFGESAYR